jgi:hypothetical protein
MKNTTNRSYLLTLSLLGTLMLAGCADAPLDADSPLNPQYENDPVARAAFSQRKDRKPSSIQESNTQDSGNSFGMGLLNFLGLTGPSDGKPSSRDGYETDNSTLTLGMSMPKVRKLWGQPQDVEVAGDPNSGNERWTYLNGLSNQWGTSNYRVVYFEQGQVAGWESKR